MNYSNEVKVVVFVPLKDADKLREAIHQAGAGKIGNYTDCSWSTVGKGRFKPESGANPAIGSVGTLQVVEEERVEFLCPKEIVKEVIAAMKRAHPYEEVAYDVYERLDV